MKSIAFINQKGGVGKTTSTLNIGVGLARLGKKVLLIDFDSQASLTYSLGIQADSLTKTIYQLLKACVFSKTESEIQVKEYIQTINVYADKQLFLIPSCIGLTGLEEELEGNPHKKFIFKRIINYFTDFDYVLVDCPPNLGLLTVNVLGAVEEIYVPVQPEFLALQGLQHIAQIVQAINQSFNPALKLGGIIGTQFNRRKLHQETLNYLREIFPHKVFNTVIRENIALAEAPSFGKDIYTYSLQSSGSKDYFALCKEIVKGKAIEG